ncbi:MAG TPA: DNA mismatch repair endonuclease MutL [Rubrobacteraceae bacterium]|nr:DNA mismatch repair endonuclease MutL [Rubrobacteraceae bacterium]
MSHIALLDPLVAQQVAAGEVVDRPASVVKELAENALDAGATRIEVEIADGGRERMRVRDDGSGMSEEDAKISVLRHATSKIRTASDIESVMTLGFRGEALPSIASVCAFSLTTSTGEGAGTHVIADGTGEVTVSPASHPKGTTVLVDRLFYNVPARRAFLKSARAERAAIVEMITNLAIAHPQVTFRLTEKGREVLSLPAAGDLIERLAQLYGVGKARAMRRVDHESGAFKVTGYAALPSINEASRSRQTVSVNGRWVRAESLTKGIDDAYRATVPAGRYPPVALCVEVDPHQVDVNVHPTKQLVRFSDEKGVRLAISEALRNATQGTEDPSPNQDGRSTQSITSSTSSRPTGDDTAVAPGSAWERDPREGHPAGGVTSPISPARGLASNDEGSLALHDSLFGSSKSSGSDLSKVPDLSLSEQRKRIEQASAPLSQVGYSTGVERGNLPHLKDLRVVGQIGSGYILVDEPLAAWIVDQHVAHERALLDRLTDPDDERMPTIQTLLVPEVVELPPEDAAEAADALEELSVYGFEVEPFGKGSFRINGVISTLTERGDVAGAFREAISVMKGTAPGMSREERILATIACHSAVKLGDKLSYEEMKALIKEWLTSRYPATCPHGRSICYRIDHKDIARKLDRH